MEQSPSWEASSSSACQIFPRFMESEDSLLPPLPVLSYTNQVHVITSYFFKTQFNITLLATPSHSSGVFPSRFPSKIRHALLCTPMVFRDPPISICV
jgi:hypothetical protein